MLRKINNCVLSQIIPIFIVAMSVLKENAVINETG